MDIQVNRARYKLHSIENQEQGHLRLHKSTAVSMGRQDRCKDGSSTFGTSSLDKASNNGLIW